LITEDEYTDKNKVNSDGNGLDVDLDTTSNRSSNLDTPPSVLGGI
jgi:hypothetical protein